MRRAVLARVCEKLNLGIVYYQLEVSDFSVILMNSLVLPTRENGGVNDCNYIPARGVNIGFVVIVVSDRENDGENDCNYAPVVRPAPAVLPVEITLEKALRESNEVVWVAVYTHGISSLRREDSL
jgi:hypothetical protein